MEIPPVFAERHHWRVQAETNLLRPVLAACCWMDICGFGAALDRCMWKLSSAQSQGLIRRLLHLYQSVANPIVIGHAGGCTERIMILNDGIARTFDVPHRVKLDTRTIAMYLLEILQHHFMNLPVLMRHDLGLRTVLAGGERIQYTQESVFGANLLNFLIPNSPQGEALRAQQFLYHPAEFQMNTAFSRAYMIDAAGSRENIIPNRLYIDHSWLSTVFRHCPKNLSITGGSKQGAIRITDKGEILLSLEYDQCLRRTIRNLKCKIYRISGFADHPARSGEYVFFPLDPDELEDGWWRPPKPNELVLND